MTLFRCLKTAAAVLLAALWLHAAAAAPPSPASQTEPTRAEPTRAEPTSAEARQAEMRAAWRAAFDAATRGPAVVPLRDLAKLQLPAGMIFIPQAEAARLSRAQGNRPGPEMVGTVTSMGDAGEWIVVIRWTADGYIRDDEAKDLDPDDILKSLREGTEIGNQDRVARGFPELELRGWTQPPQYDPATHRLAWSLGVITKGGTGGAASINVNTRALGREGYFSLNLITGEDTIERDRAVSATLLSGLDFNEGKRYSDFNSSTDRVAEYGLAALIGVVVAKKLGLIALAGVFLLKFAKVGALAVVGVGLALKRLFRKRPTT